MSVHEGPSLQTYGTPLPIVAALEREIGPFDLDVCSEAWSAKAPRFIELPENGLTAEWAPRNFCNPPYRFQFAWLARAAWWAERHGFTSAVIVRASTDARYWFRLVTLRGTCDLYRGRIHFIDPVTRRPKSGTTFASAVALYGPAYEPGVVRWRDSKTGDLIDVARARDLRGRNLWNDDERNGARWP